MMENGAKGQKCVAGMVPGKWIFTITCLGSIGQREVPSYLLFSTVINDYAHHLHSRQGFGLKCVIAAHHPEPESYSLDFLGSVHFAESYFLRLHCFRTNPLHGSLIPKKSHYRPQ